MRARVCYIMLGVGWFLFVAGWGPLPLVRLEPAGVMLGGVFGRNMVLEGSAAALGPLLLALSLRPTDAANVRAASWLMMLFTLSLATIFMQVAAGSYWAYANGSPAPPFLVRSAPRRSPLVAALGGVSLLQALAQLLAAAALFSSPLRVPRRALTRLWHTLRCLYATQSVLTLLQLGMALQLDPSFKHSLFFAHRVVWCVNAIAGAVVLTARRRRRIQASIARALLPEDRRGLAAVGALMGGKTSAAAFAAAAASFRSLSFRQIRPGDLASSADSGLHALTRPAKLGEVDAFVSHSWLDDGEAKFEALAAWAESFESEHGRPACLWLDKARRHPSTPQIPR